MENAAEAALTYQFEPARVAALPAAARVLSEAVANVARYWKIPNERLGLILGISDSSVAWLTAPHPALGGVPLELMSTITGMIRVCDFVDTARARV